jgi:hypothetical protein
VVSLLLAFPPISYMHSSSPHLCYIPCSSLRCLRRYVIIYSDVGLCVIIRTFLSCFQIKRCPGSHTGCDESSGLCLTGCICLCWGSETEPVYLHVIITAVCRHMSTQWKRDKQNVSASFLNYCQIYLGTIFTLVYDY